MSRLHWFVVAAVGALLMWLFWPALGGGASFVFRDAAHFYHPLFEFIRSEWGAGRVPLWNPYENLGVALAGDTTSSVFYPGKLLFALPLDFTLLYNLYVVGHVGLAAATSFWLARHLGTSVVAGGLAAVSYAFSGSVLFQYANVVFLVGAAWLPLALLLADRMLRERAWRPAVGLGVVLALMITGGDPQMAYNAMLLAVLDLLVLRRAASRAFNTPSATELDPTQTRSASDGRELGLGRAAALFALAVIVCLALAAVQILPSWQTARQSARAAYDSPRNLYELAAARSDSHGSGAIAMCPWYAGLLGISAMGHERAIYDFSVGPWRAIELVWPNIAGRQFPTWHRWLDALPAEGRVWTPSLYLGLLPLVLGLAAFSMRRAAPPAVRWLSWLTVLSAAASLGVYGVTWMVRDVAGWFGMAPAGTVGDEVGGLYWLMKVVLPGYVYFRYPAKLLVIASLGVSILAGLGLDGLPQSSGKRTSRVLLTVAIASISALALTGVFRESLCTRLAAAIRPDALFGPFDCVACWQDMAHGLLQTSLIASLGWVLLGHARHWRWAPMAILLITTVDLAASQAPLIPYAPARSWERTPRMLNVKRATSGGHEELAAVGPDFRYYRDPACRVEAWRNEGSCDRQLAGLDWDIDTLLPKYNLPLHAAVVESGGTLAPLDMQVFWDVARWDAEMRDELPHSSVLDLTGALVAVAPARSGPRDPLVARDVVSIPRPSALPRAWIVHDVAVLPELQARTPSLVELRTEEVLFPENRPRDWSTTAVVESDHALDVALEAPADAAAERCAIALAEPDRIEIDAALAAPGLVVLADAYAPGWTLTVETNGVMRRVPIMRANRVMRGAALPAGRHRLVYEYRPASFRWGAAISAVAVVLVAVVLAGAAVRTRRSERAEHAGSGGR